ncbi:hypothetical protein DesfrDRAFT_3565 [Solidesulfovibrio fructosivorans JJ]]|uniref:Uncharacterized protein n=1 Tax=Solidesulfovibrio fructosivorans JJ] TaxID=596151 RepID=E1K115_SOLFR|nr:hypothetical protein DesfrDRAFT_3565 [Solidesulfovibrio fructosivorans JJ]]
MEARDLEQLKPVAPEKISGNLLALLVPPDPDDIKLGPSTAIDVFQSRLPSGDPGLIFFIEGTAIRIALYGLGREPLIFGIVFFRLVRRDVGPKAADQVYHGQGPIQRAGFDGMFAVAVLDDQAIAVRPDLKVVPREGGMNLLPSNGLPQGFNDWPPPLLGIAVKGLLPRPGLNRGRYWCQLRLRALHGMAIVDGQAKTS